MKFQALLFELDQREITFPDGRRSVWEVAAYPNAATAVAVLGFLPATRELVMIRNYRPSLGDWSIEVAGGLPAPGESLADAATREFQEETGFLVQRLIPALTLYSLPGLGYFPIACFIVEATHSAIQVLDQNERIVPLRFAASPTVINATRQQIREPVSLALLDHFLRTYLDVDHA